MDILEALHEKKEQKKASMRAYMKAYYVKNGAKILEAQKPYKEKFRSENKEHISQLQKKYYQAKKAKLLELKTSGSS